MSTRIFSYGVKKFNVKMSVNLQSSLFVTTGNIAAIAFERKLEISRHFSFSFTTRGDYSIKGANYIIIIT